MVKLSMLPLKAPHPGAEGDPGRSHLSLLARGWASSQGSGWEVEAARKAPHAPSFVSKGMRRRLRLTQDSPQLISRPQ